MTPKETEKWALRVYGSDGRELWGRDYETHVSANRAVPKVRTRHPGSRGEVSRYVFRDDPERFPHWTCAGRRGIDVFEVWDDRNGSKRGVVAP